jgi:hypothetical protein
MREANTLSLNWTIPLERRYGMVPRKLIASSLRRHIPARLIEDHILALYFRGFERVYELLKDSRTFLIHLVLHEVAHIKHDWRQDQEAKCDEWAFSNVPKWLET